MAKYCVIAYTDEDGYTRKETTVEARDETEAWYKASRLFPEYHELGIYEVKNNDRQKQNTRWC